MKFLHTSITVKDMDKTIKFYIDNLGLKLVNRKEIPENNAEIAFLEENKTNFRIELTYWKEKKDYSEGDQLDHLAFEVEDIDKSIADFRQKGVKIAKEPYSLSNSNKKIAFIIDPNGIWIELIQPK